MSGVVLALLLSAAGCDSKAVAALPAERQAAGCALWAVEGAPATVDRPALEAVYARPEFARARLRNQGTLQQLLRRFFAWLDSLLGSRGAVTYAVATRFLVLVGAALVVGWAALRLLSRRRARLGPATGEIAGPGSLNLDDPAAHLGRARSLLAADPRAALREGLLALLSRLERQRLARPDRVKTNRELARELPARGATAELTARVERLLGGYDRSFYSLEPVASADAARFLDDVELLATSQSPS